MKIKSVSEKDGRSIASGVGIGVLISVFISLILAMAVAALIANDNLSENGMGYFALIIALISAAVGGIVSGKKVGGKYALATGLTGLLYCLVLICVGILFFDGEINSLWTSIVAITVGVVASCVICITGSGGKRRRKKRTR